MVEARPIFSGVPTSDQISHRSKRFPMAPEKGKSMSANHFQILANSEAWVVTLSGKHLATCHSRAEAYDIACKKAEELGSGEIFVHDATGELEFRENIHTPRREDR
ncbi:hypothetical protein AA310_13460 [Arthrobacter sp. YC-RL1]|nr:hypothetical protein ATC04_04585 [Arthrobacter sp. YC-RL1]KLI88758.1 hypothetical protein AA310_13460 [Arthrobacter sp. YC-RL1]